MGDLPPEAIAAVTRAVAEYEPQATAAVIASPKQLLSVLLEAARRATEAAAPHIVATEIQRIRAFMRAISDGSEEIAALWDQAMASGARDERERIARMALDEADRGAKSGLDRIALRAFAHRLGEQR
jgi:hypothetical protein